MSKRRDQLREEIGFKEGSSERTQDALMSRLIQVSRDGHGTSRYQSGGESLAGHRFIARELQQNFPDQIKAERARSRNSKSKRAPSAKAIHDAAISTRQLSFDLDAVGSSASMPPRKSK